jgi:predicted site-specific integrase-resolvase
MATRELLTAEEVAGRLRIRPETLKAWARRGRIPRIRISPKVVRFDLDAVIESLRSRVPVEEEVAR